MGLFSRDRKRSDRPHYPLERVRAFGAADPPLVEIEGRALESARRYFPSDIVRIDLEITEIVAELDATEFAFSQEMRGRTPADIYKVEFEGIDYYVKLKIEISPETGQDVVTILQFKPWVD